MCESHGEPGHQQGQQHSGFTSLAGAMSAVRAGLAYITSADAASAPADALAGCLRELERAESVHTAARARVMSAFNSQAGFEADACGSVKGWLVWQTRITRGAAAGAMGWMKRLAVHAAVAEALAAGEISPSWARQVCIWSEMLPPDVRDDADAILLDAARRGAELADLAALAEEMHRRTAPPDDDGEGDGGFGDRSLRLDLHFRGAGKLTGDLTPECAAALTAVLESLGKKAGPEDDRTQEQRHHDALEDACTRLVASQCVPDRAGQATQVQLHMTLDQLRSLNGAADAEAAWAAAARGGANGQAGWLSTRAAAEAYACDARITPIVTGTLSPAALAAMTGACIGWLRGAVFPALPATGPAGPDGSALNGNGPPFTGPGGSDSSSPAGTGSAGAGQRGPACTCGTCTCPAEPATLTAEARARLQDTLLRYAADVLSGPEGLAACLRHDLLDGQFPSVSLPLDVGTATNQVPEHIRRAVIERDHHCSAPGCYQPPAACHVHHDIPRSEGGTTSLANCRLLCAFHHLIAIHRWGWTIQFNADATTTMTSPDGKRQLHGHGPPSTAAA
jgi:hypothetical protein